MRSPTAVRLTLSEPCSAQGLHYQVIQIDLATRDRIIEPETLATLELPSGIDTRGGIILSGRAPIWLYAHLVHELHPTAWVACFDPRLGAVVVATHSRQTQVGQVIPVQLHPKTSSPPLCPALMVVGPPDSGKSVLSHALLTALLPAEPDIFLQRANWDGEGNWILELPNDTNEERETCKHTYKGELSDRFFPHHADAILNLRQQKQLVIVDVGGKVQDTKLPILDACSHYLVISANPEKIPEWHEFCGDRGNLKCLAVIHSRLEPCEEIHQREPVLEITCGPWQAGSRRSLPDPVLQQVRSLLPTEVS